MIYSKGCLLRAIEHVIPQLIEGGQLPRNVEFDLENWVDLIGAVSSEYFIIEDYDDLNPSVKYGFVVIKHAARELKEKGYISFGDQEVEFLGDKLN